MFAGTLSLRIQPFQGFKTSVFFSPVQIDNIQALTQCPGVLVCVGREPSHPSIVENFQKSVKLPKLNLHARSDVCNEEQEGRSIIIIIVNCAFHRKWICSC